MAPDERRAAILDAVIPLLAARGAELTTRQIAQAAGVAEGTIFRVFRDKQELLHEAARRSLDPARVTDWIGQIDPDADLETKLREVVETMTAGFERVMDVMIALRGFGRGGPPPGGTSRAGPPDFVVEANRALLASLTELLEPHAAELRLPPERAALLLRGLVFGSVHPGREESAKATPEEITTVLLCGLAAKGGARRC
jgi:AcrR family transcriptional regulator